MKISLTLLTTMVVLVPAISSGFGGKSLDQGLFWGADLDRNERIDRDEAKAAFNLADPEIFARYDEDGNGSINQFEFSEFFQQAPWTGS